MPNYNGLNPRTILDNGRFTSKIPADNHIVIQKICRRSPSAIMSERTNLFPTLGEVASRTDALADVDDDDARLKEDAPPLVEQEEGEEREMQEIESLCMRCHEQVGHPGAMGWTDLLMRKQGATRILLTSIPYFKEIVVSSFRCERCGHRDTEIQSAGEIQRQSILRLGTQSLSFAQQRGSTTPSTF